MSSRSQGTKNRHATRKHRSGRKRGAQDAKAPALARNGHAAPTPAQFGARAPLASKAVAPDVPSLSLRGRFLAPEMRQAQLSRMAVTPAVAISHAESAEVEPAPAITAETAPETTKPPRIMSAIVRPISAPAPGMAHLSISFRVSRNGPPLLEQPADAVPGITAPCPQGDEHAAFASMEMAEVSPEEAASPEAAPVVAQREATGPASPEADTSPAGSPLMGTLPEPVVPALPEANAPSAEPTLMAMPSEPVAPAPPETDTPPAAPSLPEPALMATPPDPAALTPAPSEPYLHIDPNDAALLALPLPDEPEPLAEPAFIPHVMDSSRPLPRHLAPTNPSAGLWGAMGNWLRSAGRMLASGFMVKKTRPRAPSPATMREQAELTQLRAENRRLRSELNGMMQGRAPNARIRDKVPG